MSTMTAHEQYVSDWLDHLDTLPRFESLEKLGKAALKDWSAHEDLKWGEIYGEDEDTHLPPDFTEYLFQRGYCQVRPVNIDTPYGDLMLTVYDETVPKLEAAFTIRIHADVVAEMM